MRVVFIAGPFTAGTAWDIEQNVRCAEGCALAVARSGAMPLCPHTNTRLFHGQCTEQFWYDGTLELLRRCDAVLMVPGWERSKGATNERRFAEQIGLPVFESTADVCTWLAAPGE